MYLNSGTKYTKLEIISVGEGDDVDKIESSMIEHDGVDFDEEKTIGDSEESSSLLLKISFILLSLTSSVVLMSSYLYRRNKSLL